MIIGWTAMLLLTVGLFAMTPLLPDRPPRIDDLLAILAAFFLLQMGLVMTFVHSAVPKDAPMPRQRLAQVLTFVIGGVTLLLPILGQRFIDPTLNFAIFLVLTMVSLVATWLIWRHADELMRDLLKDSCVAGYFVIVTALCIYATGERLGLLGGVTAWGALAFASLSNIACSFWAIYRRGVDRPPSDD